MLRAGDRAPDFALPTLDGRRISLADVRQEGYHVLLVFLRHLG